MRLQADVIAFGGVLDDHMSGHRGIGIPIDGVFRDGDGIGLAVAIDVGHRDGVTDVADVRINRLGLEGGEFGGGGWSSQQRQEQAQRAGRLHRVPSASESLCRRDRRDESSSRMADWSRSCQREPTRLEAFRSP